MMRTELVHFRRGAPARTASTGLPAGVQADGTVICAIDNCPAGVSTDDLLNRLRGLFPGEGTIRVDFADLPAPRDGNCCGGACGG